MKYRVILGSHGESFRLGKSPNYGTETSVEVNSDIDYREELQNIYINSSGKAKQLSNRVVRMYKLEQKLIQQRKQLLEELRLDFKEVLDKEIRLNYPEVLI